MLLKWTALPSIKTNIVRKKDKMQKKERKEKGQLKKARRNQGNVKACSAFVTLECI